LVRHYKRKRNPRGRMLRAVELRAGGKSLREIADLLGCGRMTVARDLEKWSQENASVSHLPVPKMPPRGEKGTAEWDGAASVIPLRRAE
jgi:transposase